MKLTLPLILAALLAPFAWAQPATQPTTRPAGAMVWYQPPSHFARWRDRGVTVLWGCTAPAEDVDSDGWCAQAAAAGFQYVLQSPDGTLEKHYADAACIAVALRDEPNGGGSMTPGECLDAYLAIKAKTSKPVILNLDGIRTIYDPEAKTAAYLAACDWIAVDVYPLNGGYGPEGIAMIGQVCDRVRRLAPGKPLIAFVESSNQQLNLQPWLAGTDRGKKARGPTAQEVAAEFDVAHAHGATSICIFPDVIGGGSWLAFDGTSDEVAGALKVLTRPK